ncbi:1-hydroxy-2-methyl-2-butenyl 4-diphosphate reductase [Streptomyces abyssalis]|uniref:1-hydroxy-2-methyl-2-butenyl 4-diphosphate reductase n=1 Tax=Streptomyces abyssalis TaxID=933944 RepID=A0A1E7JSL5_9ACTN|nr:1-hydroxy-2-methyl-2-butenyl 4-diphosphate reductase [Streptomyces abyssalis]OEU91871.1 1-hydroxy-2-methyl-2-butenyl 4-diphosphate reductase [Streptomyces abyssalis]OEU93989.1 1-hydroxy-2-methyl-2-butenyl 4-diphosphate reductase [Streptomyces abyssalis]OEV04904.1 1-hydroxy-2-methyl-2-butenyl 4-diphosphate reductase [Streptomyces nanshensis]
MTVSGDRGPLLIACALGIERLALRRFGDAPDGADGQVTVVRTGMGPHAAERAVARVLRDEREAGSTAVVATGFCAGLLPGMHPGDLVVADETRDAAGRTECTGTKLLADALRPHGTVHVGPLAGSAHIVHGPARAALHSTTAAVAADMESAATLRTATLPLRDGAAAGPERKRPVAAVRVVVDAPGHELIRPGTLRGGISAFRVLRGLMPAFLEWHRSLLLPWR